MICAKVKVAPKFTKEGENPPLGYKNIIGNWVFDIKMDFNWKECFFDGGQLAYLTQSVNYYSLVSQDTVDIMLNIEDRMTWMLGFKYTAVFCVQI